jgi:SPP1 gp7 family putative phage head morphogenesis protein
MDERMFWVSGVLRDDLTKRAQTILMQAIKNGEPLDETIEKLGDVFEPFVGRGVEPEVERPARLETIVRTNLTEAYNTARLAELHDSDLAPFVEGVRYSAILDSRTTEICEFLHDKVFRVDDPDLDRLSPPNHFNCRSVLVPVIVGEKVDAYATQDEIDRGLEMISEGFGGDRKTFMAKEMTR